MKVRQYRVIYREISIYKHLLIIEDDAENKGILRDYPKRHGCACTQAFSGSEGRLLPPPSPIFSIYLSKARLLSIAFAALIILICVLTRNAAAGKRLGELSHMLEELFLYTRLTGGDYALPRESLKNIEVFPLPGECLLSLYAEFEEKGISPEVIFESEDFTVIAEEEALQRIFLNLIQNTPLHGQGGIPILQKADLLVFENPVSEDILPDTEQLLTVFTRLIPPGEKALPGLDCLS